MSERIHDDEPDTSEATVRMLLARQCPGWAGLPLTYQRTTGTDNAMWRLHVADGADMVVRLPRRAGAAATVGREVDVLQRLSESSLSPALRTPRVRYVGHPEDVFLHDWVVLEWLHGADAWTARGELDGALDRLAVAVGEAVCGIRDVKGRGVGGRRPGDRGGPIGPLLHRLNRWLTDPQWDAASLLDVPAVRRLMAEAFDLVDDPVVECFVHGDLIPGNLLVDAQQLTAIIDWGGAALADPAQDLAPAWAVFEKNSRQVFRDTVGVDDATWLRARTFELEHAVGGVLYYVPRRHQLGDVMARTLHRLLHDE